jgi:hypothetical protein
MKMSSSKPFIKFVRISLSSAIMLSLASAVTAEPQIEQAYLNADSDMVIEGSGFGGGPTVALHDDFSNAELSGGEVVFHPQVGEWYEAKSYSESFYLDTKNNGKSLYARGDGYSKLTFGVPDSSGPLGLKTFQEVYFSYTIKDLGEFPGSGGGLEQFSSASSTKDAWMMLGDRGDNTAYSVSRGKPAGNDLYIPGWTGGGFNLAGNNSKLHPSFWQGELTRNWDFGGWNTKMFHAELDPKDPYGPAEGFFSFLNENAYHVNTRDGNFMEDLRSEGVPYASWDRIKFFAWLNADDAEVNRVLDEVYVAIGPNANARLLLSDGASLEKSSQVFHLSPKQWTDSEIVANFPDYLPDGNAYFLHVVDSENSFSEGFTLCQSCPKAPSVYRVE